MPPSGAQREGSGAGETILLLTLRDAKKACCKMQVLLQTKGTAQGRGLSSPGSDKKDIQNKLGEFAVLYEFAQLFFSMFRAGGDESLPCVVFLSRALTP